jgi:hypothetical protein
MCSIDVRHSQAYAKQKKPKTTKTDNCGLEKEILNNLLKIDRAAPNHPSFSGYAATIHSVFLSLFAPTTLILMCQDERTEIKQKMYLL